MIKKILYIKPLLWVMLISSCTVNRPVEKPMPTANQASPTNIYQTTQNYEANAKAAANNTSRQPRTSLNNIEGVEIMYEPLSAKGNTPYEVYGVKYRPLLDASGYVEKGEASWYGPKFHGMKTSNGEIFDMHELTAAHKTLPIPSYVRVTNLDNQKTVVVRVNDRGPFIGDRIIDLSYATAKEIGMANKGVGNVLVEVIKPKVDENTIYSAAYYVQAGAFGQIDNAEALKEKIKTQGYNASVKRHEGLYKVKVGPYQNPHIAYEQAVILSEQVMGYSYHVTD